MTSVHEKQLHCPELVKPLLISKPFRFLWFGNSLSTFGSSITNVILPIIVYNLTQSPMAMGIIMTAYLLPEVLILPVSGLIVDRFNRAKLMRVSDISCFFLLTAVMLLSLSGHLTLHWLVGIVALIGLMSGLFEPAFSALRATVFTPEIRNSANALSQFTIQLLRLVGPAAGGMIVTLATAAVGFGFDGVTYLISYFCLLFLTRQGVVHSQPEKQQSFFKECFAGVTVVRRKTWLWVTIVFFGFVNIGSSGTVAILVPWLIKVHQGMPAYVYGLVMSGSAIGSIATAFVYGMRKRWKHRGILGYCGISFGALAMVLMPFVHQITLLIVLMACEGAGSMLFGLIWETSLQELVAPEAFGRVASIDLFGSFALLPIGYLLTGWLASVIGGVAAMELLSGIVCLASLMILAAPGIRHFD
ncbi:MAG: MFS transporter [Sporolactobacillus sp.]